jgi:peroxiredoxin
MKAKGMFHLTFAATCVWVLMFNLHAAAAGPPPKKGDMLPPINLVVPEDPAQRSYLGVSGEGMFQISRIKAQLVIIEIFSMYCPVCQTEARRVNTLYETIKKHKLQDKIKLIGLGANNSTFEVDFFRKSYEVPFPLFADGDMAIYNALGGELRTPYFMGVKIKEKGSVEIFYTLLGGFENPEEFLQVIIKQSGLE